MTNSEIYPKSLRFELKPILHDLCIYTSPEAWRFSSKIMLFHTPNMMLWKDILRFSYSKYFKYVKTKKIHGPFGQFNQFPRPKRLYYISISKIYTTHTPKWKKEEKNLQKLLVEKFAPLFSCRLCRFTSLLLLWTEISICQLWISASLGFGHCVKRMGNLEGVS